MICKDKSVGASRSSNLVHGTDPAVYPAFCMQSLSLKILISIYLKPEHKPAMDFNIRRTQGGRVPGLLDHNCGALVPGTLSGKFPLSLDGVRSEDKGTNEGTISKSLCSLKDLRLLRVLQILA